MPAFDSSSFDSDASGGGSGLTTEEAAQLQAIYDATRGTNIEIVSPVSIAGNKITVRAADSWLIEILGLGNIEARTKLWFSVNEPGIADDLGQLFIEETAGLTTVAGIDYGTSGNASIVVDDETTGDITITVEEAVTLLLSGTTSWAIKMLADGDAITLATGRFVIAKPGIKAIT